MMEEMTWKSLATICTGKITGTCKGTKNTVITLGNVTMCALGTMCSHCTVCTIGKIVTTTTPTGF